MKPADRDAVQNCSLADTQEMVQRSLGRVRIIARHLTAAELKTPRPAVIMRYETHGTCTGEFRPVEKAFRNNFELGVELGSQVCVYHKGKCVVDLWGKTIDPPCTEKIVNEVGRGFMDTLEGYGPDSLQQVMSSTKNVTAICIAMSSENWVGKRKPT